MLRLIDLITHGGELLTPREALSPYRYMERLVNKAATEKYGLKDILEVGPGAETIFAHLSPAAFNSITLLDYNQEALDKARERLAGYEVNTLCYDVTAPGCLDSLAESFDGVLANALLEHLEDDAAFVAGIRGALRPGGVALCTTVLNPGLYNLWDYAVGHYRRYTIARLRDLFADFSEVQIIQSSLFQELIRPFFFHRIRHLEHGTLEENNRRFSQEHEALGRPPYAGIFWLLRWLLPVYLFADWSLKDIQGGIALVVAVK